MFFQIARLKLNFMFAKSKGNGSTVFNWEFIMFITETQPMKKKDQLMI